MACLNLAWYFLGLESSPETSFCLAIAWLKAILLCALIQKGCLWPTNFLPAGSCGQHFDII